MEADAIAAYGNQQWQRSTLESASIETLIQMAMALAAADNERDLKSMMTELSELRKRKEALRESQEKLKQQGVTKARLDSIHYRHNFKTNFNKVNKVNAVTSESVEKKQASNIEIENVRKQVDSEIKSLDELSEEKSLKIQMTTDRYNKFQSALSNLLKKASDTSSGIIANLK